MVVTAVIVTVTVVMTGEPRDSALGLGKRLYLHRNPKFL